MTILCAGINHHIAPVEVRERFAISDREVADVLKQIRSIDGLNEAVIVSTCNRVEFYATSVCPERTFDELRHMLETRAGIEAPLYHHDTLRSVRHLFRVASGLDSMVLGETEILGQVKQAYAVAADAGATSHTLNRLFQNAFRVAKAVRTDTQITRGATSVGAVAVELASKIFGDLSHRRVMVLGAGETSERVARSFVSRGVKTVIVSNRTFDRAAQLAGEIGGMAIHFDNWQNEFSDVDILVSSTAAPHTLITSEQLDSMMRQRSSRPLFIIDLAVPRDVEPSVNCLDGVFLYDIDSLQEIANCSLSIRHREIEHCERIIDTHVTNFVEWLKRRQHAFR